MDATLFDELTEAGGDFFASLDDTVGILNRQAVQGFVVGLAVEDGEGWRLDLVELQALEERLGYFDRSLFILE